MRWAGYFIVVVALMGALTYVAWFNPEAVELHLTEQWTISAPLAAQLITAFLAGALLVLLGTGVRESRRALSLWRRRRLDRKEHRFRQLVDDGQRALWDGNTDRARTLLVRAWKSRPTRDTLLSLMTLYTETDAPAEARRLFQTIDGKLADDPVVLCELAAVCRGSGDTTAAITTLERARGRYPRAGRILSLLRDLYIDAGRWNEAAAVHGEVLALKGQGRVPSEQSLLAGTRYEAALRISGREARTLALEDVAAKFPRFVPAAVSLGDELLAAGRRDDAVRVWEHLFRQYPRAILAERLVSAAGDRKARDRLRGTLRKLRHDQLDDNALHLLSARLWLEDGDLDACAKDLAEVPDSALAPTHRVMAAELEERRQQTALALESYRQASRAVPAYHCTRCGRGATAWQAFCPPCRRWDTYRSAAEPVRD